MSLPLWAGSSTLSTGSSSFRSWASRNSRSTQPGRLASMLPRHWKSGAQLCSTSRSIVNASRRVEPRDVRTRIDEAFVGEDGRAWRRPSGRRWAVGAADLDGAGVLSVRRLESADLRPGCRQAQGGTRRRRARDDRDSSDRPSGVGVHRVSSTASRSDAVVGWWFGWYGDRSPRRLRKAGRPFFEPRREDRVGIARDVHAGRASVGSTWLSATIAARRVRVA